MCARCWWEWGSLCVYLQRLIGVWGYGGGAVTLWTLTSFWGITSPTFSPTFSSNLETQSLQMSHWQHPSRPHTTHLFSNILTHTYAGSAVEWNKHRPKCQAWIHYRCQRIAFISAWYMLFCLLTFSRCINILHLHTYQELVRCRCEAHAYIVLIFNAGLPASLLPWR